MNHDNTFRSCGIAFVVSAIVFFVTIAVWPFFLGSDSSPDTATSSAARAAHLIAEKSSYLALWTAESLTMSLLAASAFVVAFRGPNSLGSSLGWSLLGVGSLANIGMYAFVMGSYFVVASIAAEDPVPYEAAKSAAFAIFNIANAVAFAGLGLVLFSFTKMANALFPKWLSVIGLLTCLSTVLGTTYGLITDTDLLMLLGPGALLGYILIGLIGYRLTKSELY